MTPENIVSEVATFVRALQTIDNLVEIGTTVFGSATDSRVQKLKESVQYYVNGTKDGFLRYWPSALGKKFNITHYKRKIIILDKRNLLEIIICVQGRTTFGLLGMLKKILGHAQICGPYMGWTSVSLNVIITGDKAVIK